MDILTKKPKVIDLRKKKIEARVDAIIAKTFNDFVKADGFEQAEKVVDAGIALKSKVLETFPCIKCGVKEAKELGRCGLCEVEHQKIVDSLNITSTPKVEKVPEDWVCKKEIKDGVTVTTYMTREEARIMGIKVD